MQAAAKLATRRVQLDLLIEGRRHQVLALFDHTGRIPRAEVGVQAGVERGVENERRFEGILGWKTGNGEQAQRGEAFHDG